MKARNSRKIGPLAGAFGLVSGITSKMGVAFHGLENFLATRRVTLSPTQPSWL